MNDNEFAARVEGNRIVANVIRGYQRQLREARADHAALWGCLSTLVAHGVGRLLSPEDADAVQQVLADRPGAALLAEAAHLQTDLDTARAALSQAEHARDAERAERRNVEQELAQLREVYNDLLRVVREREAGR